jgi:hypothetical protein
MEASLIMAPSIIDSSLTTLVAGSFRDFVRCFVLVSFHIFDQVSDSLSPQPILEIWRISHLA